MSAARDRAEIDEAYTWELESIFGSDAEWEAAYAEAEAHIRDLSSHEGETMTDSVALLETLQTYERVMRDVSVLYAYAQMRRDENTTDDHYQGLTARARSLYSQAAAAGSFIEPEIQAVERDEIDAMIRSEPELEIYEHYLDDVHRLRAHTRSAEVESLLADLGEVLGAGGEVYTMLSNADLSFPSVTDPEGTEIEITLANFVDLQRHRDREFRQRVYERFYDQWNTVRNAVAASYQSSVKADVKLARARGYDTAREAALNTPNIPVSVYDALLETVDNHLDLLHRHVRQKRRAIDVEDIQMWDVYMPMTRSDGPTIPFDDAARYVTDAVAPLGEDYRERVATGLDSRWVDVYETPNKRAGAYSGGTYDTQPFILLNYQDTVDSMFTLAHELGHSLHSELASEHQPYVYSTYETFVAEVASTVNETLLTHHILETASDEHLRRHVLDQFLENFRTTLYRQTMFADFELRAHRHIEEDQALTPDVLDDMYYDLKADYYAPATLDDRIAREWMRIPHFYRSFYVFQYATGLSAAVALVTQILEEGTPAAERYLDFLRRGSRKYPLDLLADAGIDMGTGRPIADALGVYAEYLSKMETLSPALRE